jgi:cytochrome P450
MLVLMDLTIADPRAFVQPDEFIPERWSTRPELILRKDAFVAFGYGNFSCAGRSLAMLQMRMVLAMIIRRFEISTSPGQEAEFERFIEDQADCFSLHLTPLPLMFKERAQIP